MFVVSYKKIYSIDDSRIKRYETGRYDKYLYLLRITITIVLAFSNIIALIIINIIFFQRHKRYPVIYNVLPEVSFK